MSPKQTALVRTATMVGCGILFSVVLNIIFMFLTVPQIGILFCVIGMGILIKIVYDLELGKAESLDRLNKIEESLPKS